MEIANKVTRWVVLALVLLPFLLQVALAESASSEHHDHHSHDHGHDHFDAPVAYPPYSGPIRLGEHVYQDMAAFAASGRRCGASIAEEEQERAMRLVMERMESSEKSLRGVSTAAITTSIEVPVYFHVITNSNKDGALSDAMINKQIQVLNDQFRRAGFTFTLVEVDRTVNNAWYTAASGSSSEVAMKNALRKGT